MGVFTRLLRSRLRKEVEAETTKEVSPVSENRGGWFRLIAESFAGAWQKNIEVDFNTVLSFHAVYACVTLIASDISKLRVKYVERIDDIWTEKTNPAYSPVLRKPNDYQTRIQFWESWIISKLLRGNTYVLKVRDMRGVVRALHVLNPDRVRTMVSSSGEVFYQLSSDNLAGLEEESILVPAREIIHDRFNCLFHPLVGVSPIFACGLAATQGLNIQKNSTKFFANLAVPSGLLLAPGAISDETAIRLKKHWEENYTGDKGIGRVAVLGDKLTYQPLTMTSVDAQLIEQLKWTAEVVCSTFHVPPYKIGVGALPNFNNVQALNVEYYSQALQTLIEAGELCLDEGLEMADGIGTEFDLDGLLRMDSVTMMSVIDKGVKAGVYSPNDGRKKVDLPPVDGGASPYLQQQNFSLAALAKRDAQDNPFQSSTPQPPSNEPPPKEEEEDGSEEEEEDDTEKVMIAIMNKWEGEFTHA